MFLDHTQQRSTVGRTPLDEWSARRRDLYLRTHDTHNRQISMPLVGFEPISAGEQPQATHLLKSWVQIPPGALIFVCCECRVLSGRGLCAELITHPEESYRLCCVVVCDLETSRIGAPYIYDISNLRVKVQTGLNQLTAGSSGTVFAKYSNELQGSIKLWNFLTSWIAANVSLNTQQWS